MTIEKGDIITNYFAHLLAFRLRYDGISFKWYRKEDASIFVMAHGSNIVVTSTEVKARQSIKYYLTQYGTDEMRWVSKNVCRMDFSRFDELMVCVKRDLREAKTIEI